MTADIGIIGLGRLGICLALNLEQSGYRIAGVDTEPDRLEAIQQRTLQTPEPGVVDLLRSSQLQVSDQLESLQGVPVLFIVVPTNSLPEGGYDHTLVESVFEQLPKNQRPVTLVVNSTTMPGFCASWEERLRTKGYTLVYNPEFIAQGSILKDQRQPDQVLIGSMNESASQLVTAIYQRLCTNEPQFCVMDLTSAEIAKLATNCFLTMKISFANALGDLAQSAGADADRILAAIGSDSRIGNKYLRYGYGFGGPCFPRDNRALNRFARDQGQPLLLSEATDQVNADHLEFQFQQAMLAPNETVIFDSVTYKPGTDILEESQQLALAEKLSRAGRKVIIRESAEVVDTLRARFGDLFTYEQRPDA